MQPDPTPPTAADYDPSSVEAGRSWGYFSYASLFVGLPLCIIPLIQKDNAFALFHAKHACAAMIIQYVLGVIVGIFAVVTCGIGVFALPLVFVPMISAIHGFMLVSRGEWKEPTLCFGIGDKLFGGMRVTPKAP